MKYLLLILFVTPLFLSGQKEDHVVVMGYDGESDLDRFGISIMDFNRDPVHIYKQSDTLDFNIALTNASISDKNGNLLLYTNGTTIMGANHDTIINGDGLYIGMREDHRESGLRISQGAMFLPKPGEENSIYLFHLHIELEAGLPIPGLYCSKIIFSGEYPFGIVTKKNVKIIDQNLRSSINAIRHGNGQDWWILVGGESNSENILLLFDKSDEFQEIRFISPFEISYGVAMGNFTPDGSKYIRINAINDEEGHYLEIFDFDRCTGTLSNPRMMNTRDTDFSERIRGVVVSPNSRYLYATSNLHIIQYDLSANDVFSTGDTIAFFDGYTDPITPILTCYFRQGFLAPDGKIYLLSTNSCRAMTVIHEPNKKGTDCLVEQHAFEMPTRYDRSLPNFPNYRLGPLVGSSCFTPGHSPILQVEIYPNPASEELVVSLVENAGIEARFELFTLLGQKVFSADLSGGKEYHYLRLPELDSGIYVYRVVSKDDRIGSGKLFLE